MTIVGLDHVDQFFDIIRHHEAGTIPPTVMWGACPTTFDSTQAPAGKHTAFMWEKPYRLEGDAANWERRARRARARDARSMAAVRAEPARRGHRIVRRARRSTSSAACRTCARPICWSALSPTIRSATTGRSPGPAPTARISPTCISADPAAIPAATSPAFRATTPRRRSWRPRHPSRLDAARPSRSTCGALTGSIGLSRWRRAA